MEQVERIGYLTQRIGYDLDTEEEHELMHIRQVAELCQGIAADTQELASIALERCYSLFLETAEVMRHSIEEAKDNEVLVLNLLQERDLVDLVYGPGAADDILDHMFRGVGGPESTGRRKAEKHARERCGNVEGLPLSPPED
jgi:tRNA U34 5-carboxymethylaminomethyl modifying GTPase MnmE/TrmE